MLKEKIVKKYKIYHPACGELNTDCELSKHDFVEVAEIDSDNLVRVYYLSQNDFNAKYRVFDVRSTCVGDLVEDLADNKLYMCMGTGYKMISKKQISIITKEDLIKYDVPVESLEAAKNSLDIVNKILDNNG